MPLSVAQPRLRVLLFAPTESHVSKNTICFAHLELIQCRHGRIRLGQVACQHAYHARRRRRVRIVCTLRALIAHCRQRPRRRRWRGCRVRGHVDDARLCWRVRALLHLELQSMELLAQLLLVVTAVILMHAHPHAQLYSTYGCSTAVDDERCCCDC
jgi:hypothetical protein